MLLKFRLCSFKALFITALLKCLVFFYVKFSLLKRFAQVLPSCSTFSTVNISSRHCQSIYSCISWMFRNFQTHWERQNFTRECKYGNCSVDIPFEMLLIQDILVYALVIPYSGAVEPCFMTTSTQSQTFYYINALLFVSVTQPSWYLHCDHSLAIVTKVLLKLNST